jgi:hypothetical protein
LLSSRNRGNRSRSSEWNSASNDTEVTVKDKRQW